MPTAVKGKVNRCQEHPSVLQEDALGCPSFPFGTRVADVPRAPERELERKAAPLGPLWITENPSFKNS